jgi:hypothetical protein
MDNPNPFVPVILSSTALLLVALALVMGEQVSGPRLTEAEHFRKCPLCGGYVDMRDRVWLDDHQGPLPHPACDGAQ